MTKRIARIPIMINVFDKRGLLELTLPKVSGSTPGAMVKAGFSLAKPGAKEGVKVVGLPSPDKSVVESGVGVGGGVKDELSPGGSVLVSGWLNTLGVGLELT